MGCVENGITKLEILGAMLKYVHCLDAELDDAILKLVYAQLPKNTVVRWGVKSVASSYPNKKFFLLRILWYSSLKIKIFLACDACRHRRANISIIIVNF